MSQILGNIKHNLSYHLLRSALDMLRFLARITHTLRRCLLLIVQQNPHANLGMYECYITKKSLIPTGVTVLLSVDIVKGKDML